MSTTIDQRVVEMQFDNRNFEQNVATTSSTLKKFKQDLKLDGATKGLQEVDTAAKKLDLSQLGTAMDTVKVKFSAWQVMAVTALANVANSAVNAGKRIVSALTIDPIKTGLAEYETQINAVQTILANTESKGTTLTQVNSALDELNKYADKTIYNFTEMTRNIGTFTAAGVDLDTSVNAIQGIANLAAVSGSNSQQASTAMYQLSQALASGTVKLMDWNSVVNAGMGGQVFQDALKETARVHDVNVDKMIKKHGSFRETLQKGWLTSEILTETLSHFTMAAEEGSEQWEKYKQSLMSDGYTEEQALAILKLSNTATDAATKVKTATQLWDTLKETAQSGWTQTWELILGDFEEAKELFSGMYKTLAPLLEGASDARNKLLEGALTSNWDKMVAKINEAGIETEAFEEKLKSVAESHGVDVSKMIEDHGSLAKAFKSGAISSDILKESVAVLEGKLLDLDSIKRKLSKGKTGEDVKQVQQALSRLKYDLGKSGVDGIFGAKTAKAVKAFQEANGLKVTGIVDESTLKALDAASGKVEGLSDSVDDLISGIDKLGGRELLIASLKNIFDAVMAAIKPIKEAFTDIFPPVTSDQLYALIEGLHAFTEKLMLSEKASNNLKRTFKGLFASLDIAWQLIKALYDAIAPVLGLTDDLAGGILETTANWGDWVVALSDSIRTSGIFTAVAERISGALNKVIEFCKPIAEGIMSVGKAISGAFTAAVSKADERLGPMATVATFINKTFTELANALKTASPFIYSAITGTINVIKDFFTQIGDAIHNADYDKLFDLTNGGVLTAIGVFIAKMFSGFGNLMNSGAGFVENLAGILEGVQNTINSFAENIKADTLRKVAIAIGILAVALAILAAIDSEKLAGALAAMTVLFGELMGALYIFSNAVKGKKLLSLFVITMALKGIATAMLILAAAMRILGGMSWDQLKVGLAGLAGGLLAMAAALKLMPNKNLIKSAGSMIVLSVALMAMAGALKLLGMLSWDEIGRGLAGMVGGLIAMAAAMKLMPMDAPLKAAGVLILTIALIALAGALKTLATMSWDEIGRSLAALAGSLLILSGALYLMTYGIVGAAACLIVAPALIVLAHALKQFSGFTWDELSVGLAALAGSLGIIAVAMFLMQTALPGAAALITIVAALLMFIPVLKILGSMDTEATGKALLTLAAVFAVFGIAAAVLGKVAPAMIMIAVAVGLLGVACALAGAGVLMLSMGLLALAGAGAGIGAAITTIISSAAALIPYVIEQLGLGIIRLLEVIGGAGDALFKAASTIIGSLVDALVASVPKVVDGLLVLIDALIVSLVKYTPNIVNGLFDFIIAVIQALGERLPDVIQALTDLVMKVFVGVIDAMKSIDPEILVKGILAVGAITALMAALALCAAMTPFAMAGVIGFGLVVAELALVLSALGALAQSMPGLMGLVSSGGNLLQVVGTAIGKFIGGLVGGFASGVSAMLPQIGSDLSAFMTNATPFIEGAKAIDATALEGVKSLVGIILALTAANILEGLTSWFTGGSSLTKFGAEIAAFGPYLKAYADAVAGINPVAVLMSAQAAAALADMASTIPNEGGVAAWFAGENSIAKFGQELVVLGAALLAYSVAVTGINCDAIVASATAAKALTDMASTVPNEGGVAAWFAGENSIAKFGTELVVLGTSLRAYSTAVSGINCDAIVASATAAKALSDMASTIPNSGGLLAWFTGENSIANFGTELVVLGASLLAYSNAVAGINIAAVLMSVTAAKALSDMTSTIPNSGGVVAWFTGENSVAKFAKNLAPLGEGISAFSTAVAGVDTAKVAAAAGAAASIAQMADTIPNQGGLVAWFAGDGSMATFAANLAPLGKGINDFCLSLTAVDPAKVTSAVTAAKTIAGLANVIPSEGGIKAWFSGEQSMATFAANLAPLGKGINDFSLAIKDVNPSKISSAANAAKTLAEMASTAPKSTSHLPSFGNNLVTLGGKLKTFIADTKDVTAASADAVTGAITKIKNCTTGFDSKGVKNIGSAVGSLVSAINKVAKVKSGDVDGFVGAINKLASTGVSDLVAEFSKAAPQLKTAGTALVDNLSNGIKSKQPQIKTDGKTLITELIGGIDDKTSAAKTACTSLVTKCSAAVKNKASAFQGAGAACVNGFAAGITSRTWYAEAKARAMANAAEKAAKRALDINSPSKVFRALGYSVPEGFAMGIDRMTNMVVDSATNMADRAINNVKDSISRIAQVVNADIDAQPTIRPVLDLSGVRSGAAALNGMLAMEGSVGMSANVTGISAMMNRRVQNGVNTDVVSAIDKLRKDLGNIGGTTYQINGVTYDDGSNISDAVKTIIRAARIERRV